MNTTHIKKYAPLARNAFITAVTKRANELGIYDSHIEEAVEEGQVLKIEGRSVDLSLKAARNKLIQRVESTGFTALMEFIAYTWFNRLCAIRYMELHDYLDHGLRVLSHPENNTGFEILEHAQDVAEDLGLNRDQIIELKLAGNQDELLYRTLLLGQCHKLHQAMPFLFEAIDDETELLLPDKLTRTDSILRGLVDDIPAQDWEQVEVIGWLYQFYISEKKDQVIGKVVKSEDIPAATQLFTPNWIVKYMVQNSLGRHWLTHYPESALKSEMEYYVDSAAHNGPLEIHNSNEPTNPEHITLIDPACGSGHILVEAYNLLKAIYEERGYRLRDIPKLILENNLYGLDIDDRAAQLSGFALMMKARADDKRIFTRQVQLNVLAIQSSKELDTEQLWQQLDLNKQSKIGTTTSLFAEAQTDLEEVIDDVQYHTLKNTLVLFEQADTLGSLIQVPADLAEALKALAEQLQALAEQGDSLQKPAAQRVLPFIQQAEILAQRYDAVVANPPYMGGKGMNEELKAFAKKQFPDSKSDLFAMFILRCKQYGKESAELAFVTPFVWMFISSYEKLREKLIQEATITTLVQLEYNAFEPACIPVCAFSLHNSHISDYLGGYIKLSDFKGHQNQAPNTLEAIQNPDCGWFYYAKPDDFKKIPGSPIAYWVPETLRNSFVIGKSLSEISETAVGLFTCDNDRFLRNWHEVSDKQIDFKCFDRNKSDNGSKYYPYNKGGGFRRWYGLNYLVVEYTNDGKEIRDYRKQSGQSWSLPGERFYFREGITWSGLTSSLNSFRWTSKGFIFESNKGQMLFTDDQNYLLGFLSSLVCEKMVQLINPTLSLQSNEIKKLAILYTKEKGMVSNNVSLLVSISKNDWNTYETSWDFQNNPLTVGWVSDSVTRHIEAENVGLRDKAANPSYDLSEIYAAWQTHNRATILEMQRLEQENNRLFIDAYGLQDELTPEVPLEQITLTVNPKYRYGGKLSDANLNNRFQSDTLAELISYAIGCMMGRYALDKAGLVYAHSGNVDFDTIYRSHAPRGNAALDAPRPETENHASQQDNTLASHDAERLEMHSHAEHGNDSVSEINNPTFAPDDDGIIPLTDQEWFADDATHRIREFIRVVWGEDSLQQNLDFIAESLCLHAIKAKSGESSLESIRRYLSTQFYKDHLKTYKKRPIYWLFSSGKQKAFECLVYLHRYNESTLSRMRTEYVTPLLGKYEASAMVLQKQMQDASTTAESNRFKKSLTALEKKQTELSEFDDKLKHTADMRISLDLDDGVKVNYGKFGDLLVDVKGVTGKK